MQPEVWITVIVKCVLCGAKKEIKPGDIKADEVPICDRCFSPMVAESAKRRKSTYNNLFEWGKDEFTRSG